MTGRRSFRFLSRKGEASLFEGREVAVERAHRAGPLLAGDRETTLDLLAASLIGHVRLGERFRDQVAVPIDVGHLLDDRLIKSWTLLPCSAAA